MDEDYLNGAQDIIHQMLNYTQVPDLVQILADGREVAKSLKTCNFAETFWGLYYYCFDHPDKCKKKSFVWELQNHAFGMLSHLKDFIFKFLVLDFKGDEKVLESVHDLGSDIGTILSDLFGMH